MHLLVVRMRIVNDYLVYATWCQKWDEMATYSAPFQPPLPFRFDCPDEWPKWRRWFEQFCVASGLSKEDEEHQVSTLLYCLGEDADDVLT